MLVFQIDNTDYEYGKIFFCLKIQKQINDDDNNKNVNPLLNFKYF